MTRERRERETVIPSFSPQELAKELEAASERPTLTPPFDASSYARILDERVVGTSDVRDMSLTVAPQSAAARTATRTATETATRTATETATQAPPGGLAATGTPTPVRPGGDSTAEDTTATISRAMYGSYLSSDYPGALVLAERVLERDPEHTLARLVVEACGERLGAGPDGPRLSPSSVVRLKRPFEIVELVELEPDPTSQIVLHHIDGVVDVAMLAELAGIPRPVAMDRLHALLDLGVLEVVSA